MAGTDIVDVNLWAPVPLVEVGDEVKGGLDGPSNKQGIVLANRTLHLKEATDQLRQDLSQTDAEKVGADAKGTAEQLMQDHLKEADPHPQYIKVSGANLPGGVVLLGADGKIPEQFMEIFRSSYIVAVDEAARLALPEIPDLTIVAQADNNTMYYLNGGEDPSVTSNWIKGQSATVVGVSKAFGRTGDVTAQTGDYNADQITETPDRVFISPVEKQSFALKQEKLIDGINIKSINGKSILGAGGITLNADDVNADGKGTATAEVVAHEAKADPHPQYIKLSGANLPNGPVLLDANGKIPDQVMEIFRSAYIVVKDEAERLALPKLSDLTIAAQADNDTLYYLNGGEDPTDPSKWIEGQSLTASGVGKVFGRTGDVKAQDGDYNAGQITETPDRVFLTPAERIAFGAKQDQLVSGSSIRTVMGESLLSSGDISITPSKIGAAEKSHLHTTADITDFTQKSQQLIAGSLEAGSGISIGLNPSTGKTTISAAAGQGGISSYVVIDRPNAGAGQNHVFSTQDQTLFNLNAHALKEEEGVKGQIVVNNQYTLTNAPQYLTTNRSVIDGTFRPWLGETAKLTPLASFFAYPLPTDGVSVKVATVSNLSVVPDMTSNVLPAGYVAAASTTYSSSFQPYSAFEKEDRPNDSVSGWSSTRKPTVAQPEWLSITLPAKTPIIGYSIRNRKSTAPTSPKTWVFQGSDDGNVWNDLHQVTGDTDNTNGSTRRYTLATPANYKIYRISISESNGAEGFVMVYNFKLTPAKGLLLKDDADKWYSASNGVLTEVTKPTAASDFDNGFGNSGDIPASAIVGKANLTVVSPLDSSVDITFIPKSQIALQKSITAANIWDRLNAVTAVSTEAGNGKVRYVVTRDMQTWFAFKNGAWTSTGLGITGANEASADLLVQNGMTTTEFNALTAANWLAFFDGKTPDAISVGVGISVGNATTDKATSTMVRLNIDNKSSWKLQTAAEVEIRWRSDSVSFKTVTAGNYKLLYQLP